MRKMNASSVKIGDFIATSVVNGYIHQNAVRGVVVKITITANGFRELSMSNDSILLTPDFDKVFVERPKD